MGALTRKAENWVFGKHMALVKAAVGSWGWTAVQHVQRMDGIECIRYS